MKNSAESYRIIPPLSILLDYDHMPKLLQANILITHKRNPRFKQSLYPQTRRNRISNGNKFVTQTIKSKKQPPSKHPVIIIKRLFHASIFLKNIPICSFIDLPSSHS